ncbi:hypothetical protein BJ741DRAFT_588393 [Chytriomyces cf. hyalinus JEL632]|nr:hypothetical protein BJ741DRAFT_588393 [Chytriomyces cf. hyalinus JEL632]
MSQQQLPAGWIMQTDPNTRAPFYVNTATGQTQWNAPAATTQYAPPAGTPPSQSAQYQPPAQQYQPPQQQYQPPQQQYAQSGNPQVPAYLAQSNAQQQVPQQQHQQQQQQQQQAAPQKQGINPLLLAGGAVAAAAVVGGIVYERQNEHFDGGVLDFLDHGSAALSRKKE